jgi:hypothetical protein
LRSVRFANRLGDGTVDDVHGHVALAGLEDGKAQASVARRVATAGLGGHGDLTTKLGELGAAALVRHGLLSLDLLPFRVSGHRG